MTKKSIFALCVLSALVFSFPTEARKKKQFFDVTRLTVDFDITHPVMTGNFLGDGEKEILLRGEQLIDEKKQPVFVLFTKEVEQAGYSKHSQISVPKNTISYDLLTNSKGYEEIVLLTSKNISRINFSENNRLSLFDTQSIYRESNPYFSTKRKLVSDVNNDGLDDIFISNFHNMSLFLQQPTGEFKAVKLPISARSDLQSSEISYSETPFHVADVNLDSKNDIVIVEQNRIVSFQQLQDGSFSSIPNQLDLSFEASGVPWWLARNSDGSLKDQSDLSHSMIEKVKDINGDNLVDLLVRNTKSTGVLDKQIQYDIYFGKNQNGKLNFGPLPDTKIQSEGTLSGLKIIDINNDGRQEILVSFFDIGVSQIVGALLSGSIDQDVFIYTLDKNDQFDDEPQFDEEVELSFSLSSGSEGQPVVITADLIGNGTKSLVLSSSKKRLAVYQNKNASSILESRSKRHRITLPTDGAMIIASDLNNDKRDELIVRYGKQDDEALRRTLVILSSKESSNASSKNLGGP